MGTTGFKHSIITFGLTVVIVFTTASICDSSSGDNSPEGSNTETYNFESVELQYDFSNVGSIFNDITQDAREFYEAHNTDVMATKGTINNLRNIIWKVNEYDEEHKPCIIVKIKPASGGDTVTYECKSDDVGNNYVSNLPNYGVNVSSIIVMVESITTEANGIRLKWSKGFDLNQQWWESIEDTALSGDAEITVTGYTKVMDNGRILVVRMTEDGYYQIVSYAEPELLNEYGVVDCDVEIVSSNSTSSPSIKFRPIFKEGSMDGTLSWSEPEAIML